MNTKTSKTSRTSEKSNQRLAEKSEIEQTQLDAQNTIKELLSLKPGDKNYTLYFKEI